MNRLKLPPRKFLLECLRYNAETGKLFWKSRPLRHFGGNVRICNSTNTRFAGKEAFTYVDPCGHAFGTIGGVRCFAHRVIWKMITGQEPARDIDHRDRKGANNRWSNLRLALNAQNQINRTKTWGASGIAGVRRAATKKGWHARIHKEGRYYHLGTFATKTAAITARHQAAKNLYGEFAP